MKKISMKGKLNLNKTTVSHLSNNQMNNIHGGLAAGEAAEAVGILSIGKRCTQPSRCDIEKWSKGLFCKD